MGLSGGRTFSLRIMFAITKLRCAGLAGWLVVRGAKLAGLLGLFWTAGCAHDRQNIYGSTGAAVMIAQATAVTAVPMALLLNNGTTYSGEFTLTSQDPAGRIGRLTGPLLASGDKLRLEFTEFNGKPLPAGSVDLIWDGPARQGYLLSEALQGYAPVYHEVQHTNVITEIVPGSSRRIAGHATEKAEAIIEYRDGHTLVVEVIRAKDLGNLPLKMQFLESPVTFTLALTKIERTTLIDPVFMPPNGFTAFPSSLVLIDELASRLQEVYGNHGADGQSDYPAHSGGQNRTQP